MNFIQKIKRKGGFIKAVKEYLYRVSGKKKMQDSIDTLYYFLNTYLDIKTLPKASGSLRKLQNSDTQLMRLFDLICQIKGWRYWLAYGTLLGAVRHKGFIPWDDDLDIAMPWEDYEKIKQELPSILKELSNDLVLSENETWLGIGYKHEKTGVWLDILPVDECFINDWNTVNYKKINASQKRAFKYYHNNQSFDVNEYRSLQYSFNFEKNNAILLSPASFSDTWVISKTSVFPLKRIRFENFDFMVPNNVNEYCKLLYGNNFMKFPRGGVEHHGGDKGLLSSWAEQNNIDMSEIEQELIHLCDVLISSNKEIICFNIDCK